MNERKISQITVNLLDYEITSLWEVWEEVNRKANEYQYAICGSEIVGVVPLKALLSVANHFIKKENLLILEESSKIQYVNYFCF